MEAVKESLRREFSDFEEAVHREMESSSNISLAVVNAVISTRNLVLLEKQVELLDIAASVAGYTPVEGTPLYRGPPTSDQVEYLTSSVGFESLRDSNVATIYILTIKRDGGNE